MRITFMKYHLQLNSYDFFFQAHSIFNARLFRPRSRTSDWKDTKIHPVDCRATSPTTQERESFMLDQNETLKNRIQERMGQSMI
ncbi:hypothetical protein PIB30_055517 [Stylosanthes scabra]|uniref:Uncharacterized protein n=1 Tax=Stylosanthes scabra TaxID=79078 RepID=A0ABU6YIE2_9FABA|nr:hypothetical protein [Stylosanthes scabra]